MFEVKMYTGDKVLFSELCESGEVLPTIAALMQRHESKYGKYEYQRTYAIEWRQIRE